MQDTLSDLIPTEPHQRLQWRLVRSYMVVSAVTTTLIGIGITLWMAYYYFWSPKITDDLEAEMPKTARSLEGYFGPGLGQVDRTGLQHWLDRAMQFVSTDVYVRTKPRLHVQFLDLSIGGGQVVVVDQNGEIMASSPDAQPRPETTLDPAPGGLLRRDRPLSRQITSGERGILGAAWQGRCRALVTESRLVCAAPVVSGSEVRAVSYFRSEPVFNVRDELTALSISVLPVVATVVFLSTLVGGVLGHMTAKRLTTQFGTIAHVAASWARGSFVATAPETPEDELGLLGRHLNRMAADLQSLLGLRRALAAVEERDRIARDLHDTVKQHVFAAGLQVGAAQTRLEAGDNQGVARSLGELEQLIAQTRTELVTILQELRPVVPGEAGQFVEVVRRTASTWSRQSGIKVDFEQEGITHVPTDTASELHRILQEALANISKHSKARCVQISFWQDASALTLEIEDDGTGFDLATTSDGVPGIGLQTMRERTRLLSAGEFEIVSIPGGGTRIAVRCDVGVSERKAA
ncbi:MAG: ATP-binding protein [Akkermansiaceae bacterium]|nr:ATP-binding protein [Armatimonadota bacterium]